MRHHPSLSPVAPSFFRTKALPAAPHLDFAVVLANHSCCKGNKWQGGDATSGGRRSYQWWVAALQSVESMLRVAANDATYGGRRCCLLLEEGGASRGGWWRCAAGASKLCRWSCKCEPWELQKYHAGAARPPSSAAMVLQAADVDAAGDANVHHGSCKRAPPVLQAGRRATAVLQAADVRFVELQTRAMGAAKVSRRCCKPPSSTIAVLQAVDAAPTELQTRAMGAAKVPHRCCKPAVERHRGAASRRRRLRRSCK